MVKQTRKFPGIGKKSGKLERRLWSMRELLKYQCLNTYLTPMLKPSKLSDLFPHARQNQRVSKYCICWTSTWRRFEKVFCCPLYSHASVFQSKLEILRPSMEYSVSNKPNEASRGLWNSTFVDNYERSNYFMCVWLWFVSLSDFHSSTNYHVAA